jgi:ATP-dependent RNA helicase RhlE
VPSKRQTLLFSATMPDDIRRLAATWLRDPVNVQVDAVSAPAETVRQSVRFVDQKQKPSHLIEFLSAATTTRTLVFTRTKHGADKVVRHLNKSGIDAEAIHGNKSQNAREKALKRFKSSKPPVLVATDVAARGLDIDKVSHVVNFDLPNVPEMYVHRIGRTGRAGESGIAVSFCDGSERQHLRAIERLMRQTIAVEGGQPSRPLEEQTATKSHSHSRPQHNGGGGKRPTQRKSFSGGKRRKPAYSRW